MSKCLVMWVLLWMVLRVTFICKQNQDFNIKSVGLKHNKTRLKMKIKFLLLWLGSLDFCCTNGLGIPGEELEKSSTVNKVPPVCNKVEELVKTCSSKMTPWFIGVGPEEEPYINREVFFFDICF